MSFSNIKHLLFTTALAFIPIAGCGNTQISPEVHEMCLQAQDYAGCVNAQSGNSNSVEESTESLEESAAFYYIRAFDKHQRGDYSGAIADYTKAIELNPSYVDAYLYRGTTKVSLKDYSGAIADYTKVIELNPMDARGYFGRGITKFVLEDRSGACADFRQAESLGDPQAASWVRNQCQ